MIGRTILHYKIIEKLGEGGMGIVYLAEDTKLKRHVAIKFFPGHVAGNSDERERFKIEAQAAAALNHPNIATIHAIEETEDQIFIVMEYIDGQDLKSIVRESRPEGSPLPVDTILDYIDQISSGLQAAHEKGIIHRDIKSANIMVTDKGKIKIMDFGLARFTGTAHVTQKGTTLGTAAYMSPEQARGDEVDERSDIWSLGVVFYEMLSGKLPFKGTYEQAVIYAILNEEQESLNTLNPGIDEQTVNIVKRTLTKDVKERYQTIADFVKDLQAVQTSKVGESDKIEHSFTLSNFLRQPKILIPASALIVILAITAYWWIDRINKELWARQSILPAIEEVIKDLPWTGEGPEAWEAYDLSKQAEPFLADDAAFKNLVKRYTRTINFLSTPSEAIVYARPYADPEKDWQYIGKTPLDSIVFPVGMSKIKYEKEGFRPAHDLVWNAYFLNDTIKGRLVRENQIPAEMELLPDEANWYSIKAAPAGLHMPGLEQTKPVKIGDFLMDRFEVTNTDFKRFVDAGGYQDPKYWKYPFRDHGIELSWQKAMKLFTDKTDRVGPSTWEVGNYPHGRDNYPVSGISWFETAAYAEFVGKSLPTIFHWDRAALTWASSTVVPVSNIVNDDGPVQVGSTNSMTRFGIYDLAGNVREWCFNESSRGGRFILGGGWNDPAYAFNDAFAQSPFDRSETNGFRCVKYLDGVDVRENLGKMISLPFRDFYNEPIVSDATFTFYLKQFDYDKTPMNAMIETEEESDEWIRQKITFDAAYGDERMIAYLFLPKNVQPPFQTIVYFPGSGAIHRRSSESLGVNTRNRFFLQSGRAFMFPIYKSTYERGDDLHSDYPEETNFWKEHIIMWGKDLSRSVDYLESRSDIDSDNLVYYGSSWGAAMGSIYLATETRFKAAILLVAGLNFQRALPEVDELHYVSRIKMPVLMLNGKYDFFFPYETSQLPFFELLGTPPQDKKLFLYDRGHSVPKTRLAKESLDWMDRYLDPIQN
jgi:serine/threonine protein kinase/dienelactone hydrolase